MNCTETKLRARIAQLQGQLQAAQRALGDQEREMGGLREQNRQLLEKIHQLEAQLAAAKKNSRNSSKPPSTDLVNPKKPKDRGAKKKRKRGGQPGHPRHQRPQLELDQIDDFQSHPLTQCPDCGSRDLEAQPELTQHFDQIELVDKPWKATRHLLQSCRCRNCQKVHTAKLPEAIAKAGLIAPCFLALLLYFKSALHCSYTGIQEFLSAVWQLDLSRGYLVKLMHKGALALAAPVQELIEALPFQRNLNVDETGHKENGKTMWTWCFRAPQFVVFLIQSSRGSEVLLEVLGEQFKGVLGSDYFSSYRKYMGLMNGAVQFCLAHLIRELRFLVEHPKGRTAFYAQPLLKAIGGLFQLIHQQVEHPQKDFSAQLQAQKRKILRLAANTAAISPIDWFVCQHYPWVHNMAERFRKHGEAYFTFLTTPGVEPTNNLAEQAIRFVVIDRKITQGTRSQNGRLFCQRIWTVIATCRLQKRSIFQYLCQAMEAWVKGKAPPSLVSLDSS